MTDKCFFSSERASYGTDDKPFIVGAVDIVDETTGLGKQSRMSLEQLKLRYPTIEIVTFDESRRRVEDAVIKAPWEISEERYDHLLNVLPPCRWTRSGWSESFYLSERITGSVVIWVIRIHSRYFEMRERSSLDHHAVVSSCEALIKSQEPLAAAPAA